MALERDWMMTSLLSDDSPPKTLLHSPPFPDQLLGPKVTHSTEPPPQKEKSPPPQLSLINPQMYYLEKHNYF